VRTAAALEAAAPTSVASKSVTLLNRVTFNSTVTSEHVDQWVVLFCVNWWERCQGVIEDYKTMARQWEYELAGDASSWLSTAVRFGEVNCATDKPLCNENNVDNYPTAQHFVNGKLASQWVPSSSSDSLSHDIARWVQQELMKTSRPDSKGKIISSRNIFADVASMWANGVRELSTLLSWRNPLAAAFGYIVLACTVSVLAYTVTTGLEVKPMAPIMAFVHGARSKAKSPSLFRALPELPEARTIVRESFEL
jgi:hypothetical protein